MRIKKKTPYYAMGAPAISLGNWAGQNQIKAQKKRWGGAKE